MGVDADLVTTPERAGQRLRGGRVVHEQNVPHHDRPGDAERRDGGRVVGEVVGEAAGERCGGDRSPATLEQRYDTSQVSALCSRAIRSPDPLVEVAAATWRSISSPYDVRGTSRKMPIGVALDGPCASRDSANASPGLSRVLVVDQQRVLADVGDVDDLAVAAAAHVDAALVVLAEADRLAVLEADWKSSRVSRPVMLRNAPSLKMLQFW